MDELENLRAIDNLLSALDEPARARTLIWLIAKYPNGLERSHGVRLVEKSIPEVSSPKPLVEGMTARAVATALGVETGIDLVQAAALHLVEYDNHDTFTRSDILETMRSCTGFFKGSYRNNLSNYIDRISKGGILIEVANDTYSIKAAHLARLRQKLAGQADE